MTAAELPVRHPDRLAHPQRPAGRDDPQPDLHRHHAEFWGNCDAICGDAAWQLWGVPNCGKGEPMQTHRVGHGAAPARFGTCRSGWADGSHPHTGRRPRTRCWTWRCAWCAARRRRCTWPGRRPDPLRGLAHPPERVGARRQPADAHRGGRPHRRGQHQPAGRPGHRRGRGASHRALPPRRAEPRSDPLAAAEAGAGDELGYVAATAGPSRSAGPGARRDRRRPAEDLVASGAFSTDVSTMAIANTNGLRSCHTTTEAKLLTVMTGADRASGYAQAIGTDIGAIDAAAVGAEAADKAPAPPAPPTWSRVPTTSSWRSTRSRPSWSTSPMPASRRWPSRRDARSWTWATG